MQDYRHTDFHSLAYQLGLRPLQSGKEIRINCPLGCNAHKPKVRDASVNKHSGAWFCFACQSKGNLISFAPYHQQTTKITTLSEFKAQRAQAQREDEAQRRKTEKNRERRRKKSAPTIIDFSQALTAIRNKHTEEARKTRRQWALNRGWPIEVADIIADLEDMVVVPANTVGNWHSDKLIRQCHTDKGPGRDILFTLCDRNGVEISGSRRATSLPEGYEGPKSMELSSQFVGGLTWRTFGSIKNAIEAAKRGEPIYLVEGAPDYAMARAWCSLQEQGAVLGAISFMWMRKVAEELKARLSKLKLRPDIYIIPHIGDSEDVGEKAATFAAHTLRRSGRIFVPKTTTLDKKGKGDLSYTLEKGDLSAVRELLEGTKEFFPRQQILDELRLNLREILENALEEGGSHVMRAPTGAGKTHALVDLLIDLVLAEDRSVTFILPTGELRKEVARRFRQRCHEKRVFVDIEEVRGRDQTNCVAPEYANAAAKAEPGGGAKVCAECPRQDTCSYKAQFWRAPGKIKLLTHAQAVGYYKKDEEGRVELHQEKHDILIIDESPLDTMMGEVEMNLVDLNHGRTHGDIRMDDASWAALSSILSQSQTSSEEMARLLPPGSIIATGTFKAGEHFWQQSRLRGTDPVNALEGAPNWRGWKAIQDANQRGWKGAYQRGGVLYLPDYKPLPKAKTTIYTDATVTKNIAHAILPNATYHELSTNLPAGVEIIQADWGASKSDLRSVVGKNRHRALHTLFADALHITHKAFLDDPDTYPWMQEFKHTAYFGSSVAKGSDLFRDLHTVIIDQFYVPQLPCKVTAERLQLMIEASSPNRDLFDKDVNWLKEAEGHMVLAQIIQAIGRIRPYSGDPKRIVLLDDRSWPGLTPDRIIQADVEVWNHGAGPQGEACLTEGISRLLRAHDGILIPSKHLPKESPESGVKPVFKGDGRGVTGDCRIDKAIAHQTPFMGSKRGFDRLRGLAHSWVKNALGHFFGGCWESCAKSAGSRATKIKTSAGAPLVVIFDGVLTKARLLRSFAGLVDWFMWEGARVYVPGSKLYAAGEALMRAEKEVTMETLGEEMGVGRAALRRCFQGMKMSVAEWASSLEIKDSQEDVEELTFSGLLAMAQASEEIVEEEVEPVFGDDWYGELEYLLEL